MKKWFSFVLVLVLALVLVGCGKDDPKPDPTPVDPTPQVEDVKPTKIEISGTKEEVEIGEEFTITVTVLPDNATDKKVKYSSSDSSVATIKDGKVTAISAGTCKITVTSNADKNIKAEFTLTVKGSSEEPPVEIMPELITINGKNEVEEGKSTALTISVEPSGASSECTWVSSDPSIATVTNGVVKGVKQGTVTITATSKKVETIKAEFVITVTPPSVVEVIKPESISISGEEEVEVGYSIRLVANIFPDGADNTVRWESTKPEVATIDDKGVLTGVSEGTTYIIAYYTKDETIKSSRFKVKINVDQASLIPINDMQGYVIQIMIADSALAEIDPFLDGYTSSDKMFKQQAWNEVGKKFNCRFEAVAYPDDAPWGTSRITWINSQAELGKAYADFFVVETDWVPQFYSSGAMTPTTSFFAKYGKNQIEPAARQAASVKGDMYAVSTGISLTSTYVDRGIFFNLGMLEKYKIENPAKLFNEGRWTYDDFLDWALAAQALLPSGTYVLSGQIGKYFQGMVNASGIRIANVNTLEIQYKHKFELDAVSILNQLFVAGAYDPTSNNSSDVADAFEQQKALMHTGAYWYVKASNRYTPDMWGEDTRYGYVPYPYHPNVSRENTYVNLIPGGVYIMAAQREWVHGTVTYEDVFRATQEMYLTTIRLHQADPSYDSEAIKRQSVSNKLDDSESVEAFLFYTAEKTLFDPIYSGIAGDGSTFSSAIYNAVFKSDDYEQGMEAIIDTYQNTLLEKYGG